MRIMIPVVVEMSDEQVADDAAEYGLPRQGGRLYARQVVEDVREYVISSLRECPAFYEGRADVSIKGK